MTEAIDTRRHPRATYESVAALRRARGGSRGREVDVGGFFNEIDIAWDPKVDYPVQVIYCEDNLDLFAFMGMDNLEGPAALLGTVPRDYLLAHDMSATAAGDALFMDPSGDDCLSWYMERLDHARSETEERMPPEDVGKAGDRTATLLMADVAASIAQDGDSSPYVQVYRGRSSGTSRTFDVGGKRLPKRVAAVLHDMIRGHEERRAQA